MEQRAATDRTIAGFASVMGAEVEILNPAEVREQFDEALRKEPVRMKREDWELRKALGLSLTS